MCLNAIGCRVLKKDGICTLAGCLLSIGVCVGTSLAAQPALWSFDACFSVIVACVNNMPSPCLFVVNIFLLHPDSGPMPFSACSFVSSSSFFSIVLR